MSEDGTRRDQHYYWRRYTEEHAMRGLSPKVPPAGVNPPAFPLRAGIEEKEKFFNAFGELWKSKEFSDIEIHCSDGKIVQAHKLILTVRSPVFSAMFSSGMKESTTNVIKIENISKSTMESLLEYMYTGCVQEVDMKKMTKIVQAADMYQMEELKAAALMTLVDRLSVVTVGDMIVLAETYNASNKIKKRIQKFLVENRVELGKTKSFQEMLNQHGIIFSKITYGVFEDE